VHGGERRPLATGLPLRLDVGGQGCQVACRADDDTDWHDERRSSARLAKVTRTDAPPEARDIASGQLGCALLRSAPACTLTVFDHLGRVAHAREFRTCCIVGHRLSAVGVIVSPASDLASLAAYIEAERQPGSKRPTFAPCTAGMPPRCTPAT